MLKIIWILLGVSLLLLALLAILEGIGGMRFERKAREQMELMVRQAAATPAGTITLDELKGLPEPVDRWLRYSGVVGQERASLVRLSQEGEFRTRAEQGWMPYEAEQIYSLHDPGFIWLARIQAAPLFNIYVRDLFMQGHGHMWVRLLGLFTVVDARGEKLDQGALLRFLGEIVWFPQAALADYIDWAPLDDNSARATIRAGNIEAQADFHFDSEGRVSHITAERYREESGEFHLDRWETPLDGYERFNGMLLPNTGRAIWRLKEGDLEYIRLRVTAVEFEPARGE